MELTSELTLSMILAVSQFCGTYHFFPSNKTICIEKVWACTRDTTYAGVMPSRMFNCITEYQKDWNKQ